MYFSEGFRFPIYDVTWVNVSEFIIIGNTILIIYDAILVMNVLHCGILTQHWIIYIFFQPSLNLQNITQKVLERESVWVSTIKEVSTSATLYLSFICIIFQPLHPNKNILFIVLHFHYIAHFILTDVNFFRYRILFHIDRFCSCFLKAV